MINKKVIENIYLKYPKAPQSPDFLDFALFFDGIQEKHGIDIDIDNNALIINSIEPDSPFHRLDLNRIHAIIPFEEWVALVLHSSIIFLNKLSPEVSVHIKETKPGLIDRIKYRLSGETDF